MGNNRGQVTIFIIIAIVLVVAAGAYFFLKDRIVQEEFPANMQPIYTKFLSCLEDEVYTGVDVLESQAGYIEVPEFEPGSRYMPFGSQLNFLGNPVPYWYYVSGNNVQKEQVPSVRDMEKQFAGFIEEKARGCGFDEFSEQGFRVNQGEPSADVEINDGSVRVSLEMQFNIEFGDESVTARKHEVEVATNLGSLYNSAKEIYEKEQDELFLENYAVDTLRLYAPVDGVELTCAPLTWSADAVFDDLKEAIELNTLALRTSGGDYSLAKEENEYFVVDVGSDARFLNSRNWSNSFEVAPSQGSVLISEPVGNQPGLGALGFCYVPYHFVYNVRYPVLVQVFDGEEIFQFPIAIVINGNKPREALESEASEVESPNICEYKNTEISVKTYDTDLKLVDSEISFECFGETCDIGETSNGVLDEKFPQCVNGYVLARADGFDDARYLFSTVEEGTAEIILDRLYAENVELKIDGKSYSGDAIISFVSDDGSQTIVYPETKKIELKEGQYEVQVDVYENSELKFDESVSQQCVDVPKGGLGGLFGLTEEQCFDITIPAQVVSNALSGGGKQNYYILESELKNSNTIEIDAGSLPEPTSLEKLQDNYVLFEGKGLEVNFK